MIKVPNLQASLDALDSDYAELMYASVLRFLIAPAYELTDGEIVQVVRKLRQTASNQSYIKVMSLLHGITPLND